jgi:hypothetical protein
MIRLEFRIEHLGIGTALCVGFSARAHAINQIAEFGSRLVARNHLQLPLLQQQRGAVPRSRLEVGGDLCDARANAFAAVRLESPVPECA